MTGFGRTGLGGRACCPQRAAGGRPNPRVSDSFGRSRRCEDTAPYHRPGWSTRPPLTCARSLFACHREGVQPDFIALAKGLTGGYLPMAATLTTQPVFDAFLGEYDEFKTFFHGHSFTGNQLGAAAALASLEMLQAAASVRARQRLEQTLRDELPALWRCPNVGDIRQVGLVAGIELVRNWPTRQPFDLRQRAGIRVCEALAKRGVLTRPIGNVVVLMPPYCTTPAISPESYRPPALDGPGAKAHSCENRQVSFAFTFFTINFPHAADPLVSAIRPSSRPPAQRLCGSSLAGSPWEPRGHEKSAFPPPRPMASPTSPASTLPSSVPRASAISKHIPA